MERDLFNEMIQIGDRNLKTKYLIPVSKFNEVHHRIELFFKFKQNDNNWLCSIDLDMNKLLALYESIKD